LLIGFVEILQLVTTSEDHALTVLHTSQITIGPTWSSRSVSLHYPLLGSGFNCKRSPSSGFPNCPRPQLPASHNNSSQHLNLSAYLTATPNPSRPHLGTDRTEKTATLLPSTGSVRPLMRRRRSEGVRGAFYRNMYLPFWHIC
jgi:hypothetical protein